MLDSDFDYDKLFQDADNFFRKSESKDIHFPKGSIVNKAVRASNLVGNNHIVQNILSKRLGIKK